MHPINLGQCSLCMQMIFKKCPFKEAGKLSKLFCLVLRVLTLPAGSDTPQNKILRGIRPRRTRSWGVSDPTELSLAGYQTPQNNGRVVYILQQTLVLQGLIPAEQRPASLIRRLTKSCGVSDPPAEQSPAAYQTPLRNKVLRGIKPRRTTFKYEQF